VNVRLIISIRMSTYFDNSMITPDHSEIIGKGSVKKRSSISRTYSPPFRENHLVASTFFDLPTDLNSHSTSLTLVTACEIVSIVSISYLCVCVCFLHNLSQSIFMRRDVDVSVRWLAVLYFKNGVDRYWRRNAPRSFMFLVHFCS